MSTTGKIEKIDRFLTTITAIPVLGWMIKKAFDKLSEKGAEKLSEKVEKIISVDTEGAKKDISDEIIYGVAVYGLTDNLPDAADKFEDELRKSNKDQAEAFVLYVAKIVKMFERDIKEILQPGKGQSGPKIEQDYKDFEKGLQEARKFLAALLIKQTFIERVTYLQGKNVFSLIPPPKKSMLDNLSPTLKSALKKFEESGEESKKEILAEIKKARTKVKGERYPGFFWALIGFRKKPKIKTKIKQFLQGGRND